ncbi:hypothetical protein HHJ49_00050 [Escherichia coli]|nr:hypothetical protein HHJ49_00050 [Escherichia coli]
MPGSWHYVGDDFNKPPAIDPRDEAAADKRTLDPTIPGSSGLDLLFRRRWSRNWANKFELNMSLAIATRKAWYIRVSVLRTDESAQVVKETFVLDSGHLRR